MRIPFPIKNTIRRDTFTIINRQLQKIMKFISFNINGIRARLHQLQAIIDKHAPEVIGLQEIKVQNPVVAGEKLYILGSAVDKLLTIRIPMKLTEH